MFANLGRFAFLSYVIHTAWSQDSAQLTFSSNPVCNGEDVTLTFTYSSGLGLSKATVYAFNGALNKGVLFYQNLPLNSTGVGVFAGKYLNGWPDVPTGTGNVSVTLTASPSLELDYNSSITVTDAPNNRFLTLTSIPARLLVYMPPEPPKFRLSPIIFNDSDSGIIICDSYNGKPATALSLTVSPTRGEQVGPENNISSTAMNLSERGFPLSKWHNALATCRVTNNNCSNSSVPKSSVVSGFIFINHVTKTSDPDVIYRNESVVLNCSAYISYFPGVQYTWTIPPAAVVTGSLNVESITVSQGHTGSFNCTATNNVTMTSIVIVFTVSNSSRPNTTAPPTCELCWIIGVVLGIIAVVVIAVVLGVLCKRGHFSKGKKKPGVQPGGADQRSDNGSNRGSRLYVYDGPASWTASTEHRSDADAFHLGDRHAQASGDLASRKGRAQSTSDVPAQDRHYTEDIRKPIRLLIAAEGVVSQLAMRVLQSTAIVEYSDRLCSLNGILEKVEQAVAQSATKFKSVALLLRPAALGVTLSEVDQAVLNSSTIKGDKREKLRAFIARLAKICLDERGGTRMDILNYKTGKAPKRLSEALTGLLGIPTTVSQDQFGVETPIGDEGGHAVVADLYFDRNNLGEVVYAVLELPTVKPPIQPRPVDEGVTYSAIRH